MVIRYEVDPAVYGFFHATCQHCRNKTDLQLRRAQGVASVTFYECPLCGGRSRKCGLVVRLAWSVLLLGALGILLWTAAIVGSILLPVLQSEASERPPIEAWLPVLGIFGVIGFGAWKVLAGLIRVWAGLMKVEGIHWSF